MRALKDFGWKRVVRATAATAIGIGISSVHLGMSHTDAIAAANSIPSTISSATKLAQNIAQLQDGVYLYGQTNQPNQLGQAYFVFEVKQGNVLGALYMPQSSFDCAYGNFQREKLALKVRDSYEQTAFDYAISLDRRAQVASQNLNGMNAVELEGFQKLNKISQQDMSFLQTCKETYQAKAW